MTFKIIPTPESITIKTDPKYESIIPKMPQNDFEKLKQSIAEKGLLQNIIVNPKGYCLDGHSRIKACREKGISIPQDKIETREYDDPLDELEDIWILNSVRRHYDEYQRYEAGREIKKIEEEKAKRRQSEAGKLYGRGMTVEQEQERDQQNSLLSNNSKLLDKNKRTAAAIAADKVGISTTKFNHAEYIDEHAPEEVKQRLRDNKGKINTEYKVLKSLEIQKKLIEEAERSPPIPLPEGIKLILGDFEEKCKEIIPDNSIPLIFTDPPYPKECLPLYEDLMKVAAHVLTEGGSLVTYIWQSSLPQVLKYAEAAGLKYFWIICMKHNGAHKRLHGYGVEVCWKPLVWFIKGDRRAAGCDKNIEDLVESKPPNKDLQEWAQSPVEAKHMIESLTTENMCVLDLFMGSGTTGIAAIELKRKFIGIEIREDRFKVAEARIKKFLAEGREVTSQ